MGWTSRTGIRLIQEGAFALGISRRILQKALVVFLYHEVSDAPSDFNRMFGLNISPRIFSRQLELIQQFFHVLDPSQFLKEKSPRPAALITFDDGNASYFRNALPILKEKKIPSIAFLNMGPIRGEVCWSGLVTYLQHCEPRFTEHRDPQPRGDDFCRFSEAEVARFLGTVDAPPLLEQVRRFRGELARPEDLEQASQEPLVYFGNHLYNHYNVTLSSPSLDGMYRKNQQILEDLPRSLPLFSFPFSRSDLKSVQSLSALGARALFTGGGLPNLNGNGNLYYRVQLSEKAVTEKGMFSEILKNHTVQRMRRWIPAGKSVGHRVP